MSNFLSRILHGQSKQAPYIQPTPAPELFNSAGEPMHVMYLRSDDTRHHPYSITDGRVPHRILWDRFNHTLDTHVSVDRNVMRLVPGDHRNVAILLESEAIVADVFAKVRRDIGWLRDNFEIIFTHSADLLDSLPNARFVPASSVWYGTERWGGISPFPDDPSFKTKLISVVSSAKSMCPLHEIRKKLALSLRTDPRAEVFGKVVGRYASLDEIFTPFRYHVAVENIQTPYYFTEKILNCFASRTVPVYIGATEIDRFFNPDGIIHVAAPSCESLQRALRQCSETDYHDRLEAIEDNYRRVQKYLCVEDYLTDNYPDFILK